jgi:transitional endoplasmic reticulum ATPase
VYLTVPGWCHSNRGETCLPQIHFELMHSHIVLSPVQQKAADALLEGISAGGVVVLKGDPGSGKSVIMQHVHMLLGGALIGIGDFLKALVERQPDAIEEAFLRVLEDAIQTHELVLVDDLHLVTSIVHQFNYPRRYLLEAALTTLLGEARALNKTLVFASDDEGPWPIARRAFACAIAEFTAADYEHVCRANTQTPLAVDFDAIHRFAPELNGHQLRNAAIWLGREADTDTDGCIRYLRERHMASNVDIEEVQPVRWSDLRGVDDVIRALEAKVALPFENDALATNLRLKPKRGVLIAGPPGTGKTTIGRALAHRLKSKFFLIDGTVVAGSGDFFDDVKEIFNRARRNAPSIVFIDDTDVIFDDKANPGFYRYLLTVLDGLESASSERVCVMMTAMNPGCIPAAMLRSGRVELWLETRLPDASAREQILRDRLAGVDAFASADLAEIAEASQGLTGADLKAVVEDAKLLFAHDVATGTPPRKMEEYFAGAIEEVRTNHRNYGRDRAVRLGEPQKMGF